jgi:hypothetical protein
MEYIVSGAKELRVVFLQYDWFDPINDTRVDDFGMHGGGQSWNALFRHQYFACTSSVIGILPKLSSTKLKNLWVVYIERHEDDDIYKVEIEGCQSFTVSDRACLAKLDTGDAELLEEK